MCVNCHLLEQSPTCDRQGGIASAATRTTAAPGGASQWEAGRGERDGRRRPARQRGLCPGEGAAAGGRRAGGRAAYGVDVRVAGDHEVVDGHPRATLVLDTRRLQACGNDIGTMRGVEHEFGAHSCSRGGEHPYSSTQTPEARTPEQVLGTLGRMGPKGRKVDGPTPSTFGTRPVAISSASHSSDVGGAPCRGRRLSRPAIGSRAL